MKTVAGVFSTMPEVEHAVREMELIGVPNEAISVIAGDETGRHKEYLEKARQGARSTSAAAASGASFGGGVGILASLGALAIPGVGPIIAGGAIATVITGLGIGAASGGLISAFHNMAIPHEEASVYEEAVRRGALMVVAEVTDPMEPMVVSLMTENGGRQLEDLVEGKHPSVTDSQIRSHEPPEE